MSDEPLQRPATAPVGPGGGATWTLVKAVAILVLVALVKPWTFDFSGPAPSLGERPFPTVRPGEATPEPTRDVSAFGLALPFCLGAGSWRVLSDETWRTHQVRVWRAIEPLADAGGPLDPRIPMVPAIAYQIRSIGFCAPVAGPGMPLGPFSIQAFRVDGDVAGLVPLRRLAPAENDSLFGELFAPPPACLADCPGSVQGSPFGVLVGSPVGSAAPSAPSSWPTGRYVFVYSNQMTGELWFGVDVVQVPPATLPGPTAPVAPTRSP